MKKFRIEDAVGQELSHDLTRIIPGKFKGVQFKKGHIITEEDIPVLLAMGKQHILIGEKPMRTLHEDEAAEHLTALCSGENITPSLPAEGKITLSATCEGLFCFQDATLRSLNRINGIAIAARRAFSPVAQGDVLAGVRIIPLVIEEKYIHEADAIPDVKGLFSVKPFTAKTAAVVITGSEVANGLIKDGFTPVLKKKLAKYGIEIIKHFVIDDDIDHVSGVIQRALDAKPDMLLCTGGMSVDADDSTPGAINRNAEEVVSYGSPVLPGSMCMVAYAQGDIPMLGLPGCVMYKKVTVFDSLLARAAARVRITKEDIIAMGNGGLCLECKRCSYPICSFGA